MMKRKRFAGTLLLGVLMGGGVFTRSMPASAQSEVSCGADGYRVMARRWDALLRVDWALKQNCAHPEWPARLVATGSPTSGGVNKPPEIAREKTPIVQPLMVHAGEPVRLWQQDEMVRIEMSGVAEQSARNGERVLIRIMRQSADEGLTVERITGIVRGAGDVEMER